jgi:hypothetical protein
MRCQKCGGLMKTAMYYDEHSRCFNCAWTDYTVTPVPKQRKRRNIVRVRYSKAGKVKEFQQKILRVQVLAGSKSRSRANPTLIGSCPYKCDNDLEQISYFNSTGYKLRCKRGHIVNVKLALEQPIWR